MPSSDQGHSEDGGAVDQQRAQEQTDRAATRQAIRHREHIEEDGTRMVPSIPGEETEKDGMMAHVPNL